MALYIGESFDWIELKDSEGNIKCPRIRIREKSSKADILMGVCYRPSNQDKEADEAFYKQLAEVSLSLALVLLGGCRRFMECVEDNFLAQPGK